MIFSAFPVPKPKAVARPGHAMPAQARRVLKQVCQKINKYALLQLQSIKTALINANQSVWYKYIYSIF